MHGVTEYNEGMEIELKGNSKIKAYNEAGFNSTEIDLYQLFRWLKYNKPQLFNELISQD